MKRCILSFFLLAVCALAAADPRLDAFLVQGDVLSQQEKYREALDQYLQAEKLQPQNVGVLVRISTTYSELLDVSKAKSDAEKCLDYAKRALAADPKSAKAHLCVAVGYGRMTDYVGNKTKLEYSRIVKEESEKSIALDGSDAYAWYLLGRWHFGVANVSGVLKMLAKVVYGGLPPASNEEALRCLKKAVELSPKELPYRSALARVYTALGKHEEAKKEWRVVVTLKPTDAEEEADVKEGKSVLGQ